jgi:predicted phosphodiesterase
MTILFAGDTHGDQRWLGRTIERVRPAALVHLGDIELQEPAETALKPVLAQTRFLWIAGNHDYDSLDLYRRLHAPVMFACALHSRIRVVDGVRIAGLGGWFQSRVWRPPEPPVALRKPRHASTNPDVLLDQVRRTGAIWWDDYQALWEQQADVLVCHEAPSCHRHGFVAIDELAQAMGVSRIFHGHHHQTYQDQIAGGIRVYGVGLRAIVDLEGQVIHPGEPKGRRQHPHP